MTEQKCKAKDPATCRYHGTQKETVNKISVAAQRDTNIRKLVTLRTIDTITPIENADAIEAAHIGGWAVVVRKGEFAPGDKAVYFEIDSLLPEDQPVFEDFMKRGVKTQTLENGKEVRGHVVNTVKLRGQISQGLVFPVSTFPELNENSTPEETQKIFQDVYGVVKYDPPIPASLSGKVVGYFPTKFVQKTDSERVQNLTDEFLQNVSHLTWVPTEKVDGTSATFIKDGEKLRVCSRNMELLFDPNDTTNAYSKIAVELGLVDNLPDGAVIQGEIYGEGIQKNPLKIRGTKLRVFNVKNLPTDHKFNDTINKMRVPALTNLKFPTTVEEAVQQADGLKSTLNPQVNAEGIVWWNEEGKTFTETGGRANFKAINNKYLLKNG